LKQDADSLVPSRHVPSTAADMNPAPTKARPSRQDPRAHAGGAQRFNANDNIAEFIEPGELEQLLDEVEPRCRACSTAW
jgi:GTP cyclohydrolase I